MSHHVSSSSDSPRPPEVAVLRILDANANRAMEGLRVAEEYVRFELNDSVLTQTCKQLRHDLAAALAEHLAADRLRARQVQRDVGIQLSTDSEYRREAGATLALRNLKRVQEALRCLEEYGKLHSESFAHAVEQLRYRVYSFEQRVGLQADSCQRLHHARLYVLVDGSSSVDEFARRIEQLVQAGVDVLQLRDKRLTDRQLLQRAHCLRELTRSTRTLFVMNDLPDLARLSQADGVHVGQEELAVADVRQIVGAQMLVGVSTHSLQQVERALDEGADYLGAGPTFPSTTKTFAQFPGLAFLRQVSQYTRLPVFAIGGIQPDNLTSVLATGIRRVAVSAAVWHADEPAQVARNLLLQLSTPPTPADDLTTPPEGA